MVEKIAVIGLGYVGLPVAVGMARAHGGVVGFDIAGPEKGFPPTRHLDAFQYIQRENFHMTIHAGEAYGPESIAQAVHTCGAHRIGHGR